MVLKENDINKFNKKVIVDVFFNNGEEKGDIIMDLEFYYDAGHGVTRPKPKSSDYKFACDVSKQAKEDPDNIFSFDKTDGYIETEKNRKVNVVDKKNRDLFTKKICELGRSINFPLFVNYESNYFFANESVFRENEDVSLEEDMMKLDYFITDCMERNVVFIRKSEEKMGKNMLSK